MAGRWQKVAKYPGVYVQSDARTGKPRYKVAFRDARAKPASKTYPTIKLAVTAQADLRVKKASGTLPDASLGKRTVAQLWKHMERTGRQRPSTMAWYEARWRVHIEPVLGARRVASIRGSELEDLLADVEKNKSVATRRAVQQLIHKLFAVAVRSEWLQRNPADGIEMPAARPRPARFLDEGEVRRIADKVPPRYRALVWTLAIAGLRVGEACALRVKSLNGSIRVVENSVEVKGKKVLGQPKTAGSERVVPIPPALRQMLKEHVQTYGNIFDPESFVFITERGAQIGQNVFRKRVFQPAAVAAKVRPIPRVHDLRHTAASLMLRNGMTPYEVATVLGHSTVAMVERTYGHLYEPALQAKVDRLDKLLA